MRPPSGSSRHKGFPAEPRSGQNGLKRSMEENLAHKPQASTINGHFPQVIIRRFGTMSSSSIKDVPPWNFQAPLPRARRLLFAGMSRCRNLKTRRSLDACRRFLPGHQAGIFKVGGVEAFGEPGANRVQHPKRFIIPALSRPQAREADPGSKFPTEGRLTERQLVRSADSKLQLGE